MKGKGILKNLLYLILVMICFNNLYSQDLEEKEDIRRKVKMMKKYGYTLYMNCNDIFEGRQVSEGMNILSRTGYTLHSIGDTMQYQKYFYCNNDGIFTGEENYENYILFIVSIWRSRESWNYNYQPNYSIVFNRKMYLDRNKRLEPDYELFGK
ncbi:MAG: hypothetical protein NTY74_14085 [Ignavibacteriae bacterium]|nr:hypothetical protein [Ignavibacteriota bacterium]